MIIYPSTSPQRTSESLVTNPFVALSVLLAALLVPSATLGQGLTQDSDGDGLFDDRELYLGLDPSSVDTDGDGFDDAFEFFYHDLGFDPLAPNSDDDQDGLSDQFEAQLGTSQDDPDTDNDGLSDLDEVVHQHLGYDPLLPSVDSDFDGLTDDFENDLGTDPFIFDTDGDGAGDAREYENGTDPRHPRASSGELLGLTLGPELEQTLQNLRNQPVGQRKFPPELVDLLPYAEILEPLMIQGVVQPSAALIQDTVFNPRVLRQDASTGESLGISLHEHQEGEEPAKEDLYPHYPKILEQVETLVQGNREIMALFTFPVGRTEAGNSIHVVKVSDNVNTNEPDEEEEEILYMALHHARELVTTTVAVEFLAKVAEGYGDDEKITQLVDEKELWIVFLLNPDGYEKVLGGVESLGGHEWRKNVRRITITHPNGDRRQQRATGAGIDLNRNYDFAHAAGLSQADLEALLDEMEAEERKDNLTANGFWGSDRPDPRNEMDFRVDSPTFPGLSSFSEVETRFIRQLVELRDTGTSARDGFRCALSWHSYGGEILYPWMYAQANAPHDGQLRRLARVIRRATSYEISHPYRYLVFGGAIDWLYGRHGILALTVETYGTQEGNDEVPEGDFYPMTRKALDDVVGRNIDGAVDFALACGKEGTEDDGAGGDGGDSSFDPRGDAYRHYAGTPIEVPGWVDIRTARATLVEPLPSPIPDYDVPLDPTDEGDDFDDRLLRLEMELYEPIPEAPDVPFASWHFLLDLDGRRDSGHPGTERPVGVLPDLGVELWVDLLWNGSSFQPFLFLGRAGIGALIPTPDLAFASHSPDRRHVILEIPFQPVLEQLSTLSETTLHVAEGAFSWVAVTNYAADPSDLEDPPSDFFPDRLYVPETACERLAGPHGLCLGDGRFLVETLWETPQGTSGPGEPVELTEDTGAFWFFDSSNTELLVKVLDACSFADRFWVFAAGLTNVEVELRVTDLATGETRDYRNPQATPFEPILDASAFATCDAGDDLPVGGSTGSAGFDPEIAEPALSLAQDRFRVEVDWQTPHGTSGEGQAVPLSDDTGTFWFFDAANLELVVKVLDGCPVNGRFWVFAGGLTDVEVQITVTDRQTGTVRLYENPMGTPFAPILDANAFATCE